MSRQAAIQMYINKDMDEKRKSIVLFSFIYSFLFCNFTFDIFSEFFVFSPLLVLCSAEQYITFLLHFIFMEYE